MEVSALGFGCMGMTYNRSAHPGKRECIALIRSAAERGVTLFDTAIIYGPLNNEELAGKPSNPSRGRSRSQQNSGTRSSTARARAGRTAAPKR